MVFLPMKFMMDGCVLDVELEFGQQNAAFAV